MGFRDFPFFRKDLKSRSANLGPYATKGYFIGIILQELLRGSWDLVSRVISRATIVMSTYNLN